MFLWKINYPDLFPFLKSLGCNLFSLRFMYGFSKVSVSCITETLQKP